MERLVRPAIRAIVDAIDGIDSAARVEFCRTLLRVLLRHGIQRGIEIISEAARRVPSETQAPQPQIPWAQIIGIGNVLRHEYHRISDTVIWNVVQNYLAPLRAAVTAIDASLDESGR